MINPQRYSKALNKTKTFNQVNNRSAVKTANKSLRLNSDYQQKDDYCESDPVQEMFRSLDFIVLILCQRLTLCYTLSFLCSC